jgi:hypothetical protein
MHTLLRWTVIGGLASTLMGCSSLHLYNSANEQKATSAKADFDASKITDSIKLSRAVFDALDTKEVEAFRALNLAERNAALLSLLSESGTSAKRTVNNGFVARFNKRVEERLIQLTGTTQDARQIYLDLTEAMKAVNAAAKSERLARNALKGFDTAFAALPDCSAEVAGLRDSIDLGKAQALLKKPDLKPKYEVVAPIWLNGIKDIGSQCDILLQRQKTMEEKRQKLSGQLLTAASDTNSRSVTLADKQSQAKDAAAQLKTATEAFASALKAVKDSKATPDLTCDLSQPAAADGAEKEVAKKNELCDALAKLKRLEDFGIQAISEERLTRINDILAAVGGEPTPADKAKAEPGLVFLSTSARFGQAWTQYQQAGKLPALEPLLIDKEITAAQLAYAQVGVQLAESRVQHAKAYEAATLLETTLLLQARAEVASLGAAPAAGTPCDTEKPTIFCASVGDLLGNKKLANTAGNGGETANRRAYRALAYMAESYSVARDRQLEAELRLIDTEYRVALSTSEASLSGWNALLSVPVDQLKAYHAGGIKPAEAASLAAQVVQALAAVGIAVRIK